MDIPTNAPVQCTDGPGGRSTYLIINPFTQTVTHLVVREKQFTHPERLVSIDQIAESTPDQIQLNCTRQELEAMPHFKEVEYIQVDEPFEGVAPNEYFMWPYVFPEPMPEYGTHYVPVTHELIPPDELAIRRGARVEATDGHIGHVNEFLIDPKTGHISHLVLREGHLWGEKEVTIPVSALKRIGEDVVYLQVDKERVEALPSIPLRRHRRK